MELSLTISVCGIRCDADNSTKVNSISDRVCPRLCIYIVLYQAKLEASQQRLLSLFTQSSIDGGGAGDSSDGVGMCVDALKSVFSKELNQPSSSGSVLSAVVEEDDEEDGDEEGDHSNNSNGTVAFPSSPIGGSGLSPGKKANKSASSPQHPLEEHGQLLAELRRIVDEQQAKQRGDVAELERRLIASQVTY